MKHVVLKTVSMRQHHELNERWVQEVIAAQPSILGLGDLTLSDKERRQPAGGRLDLLLKDIDALTWYEAELQLGATDETHIIRTIEYWDIERRRYPQYTHVAVLIAEEVTARFLNVIRLFNGYIPLIALQMSAIEIGDGIGLHFSKVVDILPLGLVEDEEGGGEAADRAYWENRGSAKTVRMADDILNMCRQFDASLTLKYNKAYIGFARDGIAYNFASCIPRKSGMNLRLRIPRSDEIDAKFEQAGLDLLEYARWGAYRLKLEAQDIDKHRPLLQELLKTAYDAYQ
jgi:predicted transport protein